MYSTYLGGNRNDEGLAIAIDSTGAAYVTGVSSSPDFPTTAGAFQTTGQDTDVFVTKLNPAGNGLVYSTLLNGERRTLPGNVLLASSETGHAIAVDAQGQACVAGETQSGNFPHANEFQTNPAGGFDAFVTKLNASGSALVFSTYLGGATTDRANGIALDGAGNVYLTGDTFSTDFPVTPGSLKTTRTQSGSNIGFVTKFSSAGTMVYSTYLGDASEVARSIAVNNSGNAFVTGESSPNSSFPVTPNAIKSARDLGAVYRSNNSAASWQGLGLTHDFVVNAVAIDPGNSAKLYAGTQAGLFRSLDGGSSWNLLGLSGLQVLCVAVDPNNPLIIFAGTNGEGIFKSIDGGTNWTNPVTARVVRTLAFHPQTSTKIYAGQSGSGLLSSDAGETWDVFGPGGGFRGIAFAPGDPNTIYLAGNAAIWKTSDAGVNWTNSQSLGSFYSAVVVDPANASIVYAAHRLFGIFKSTNAGQSWNGLNTSTTNEVLSLAIDGTTTPSTLYAGLNTLGVIKSVNGGTAWQTTELTYAIVNSLTLDRQTPSILYAGSGLFNADAFLSELNSDGSALLFSTYLGGGGPDSAYSMAIDAAGNPLIAGRSSSVDFPLVQAVQQRQGVAPDAFVVKLDIANPAISFSSMVGGNAMEDCRAVAVDPAGNIYLGGITRSTDFPSLTGVQPNLKNIYDGFVSKIGSGAAPSSIQWNSATYSVSESAGQLTVSVKRLGDATQPATVDYATDEGGSVPTCSSVLGLASARCDFTTTGGTLKFAAGETQKTVDILVSRDTYNEGPETFSIILSNPTGGVLISSPSRSTITINDGTGPLPPNAIDDPRTFVGQHYHDFLSRQADASGWDFWTNQITSCGSNAQCTEVRQIDVSASFFLSIEFQQTGYLVERFYKTAFGDASGTSRFGSTHQLPVPTVRLNEFLKDTQRIGQGVIVLQPGWEQLLENNKQAYALEFVQTSRFLSSFPAAMTPAQFVDKLNQNAGNVLTANERTTAINLFGNAADSSNATARAQAIRQVADDSDLYNAEYNRAFVLAEYFGYLRRNPNDTPESTLDYTGYDFWLTKLNQFNGNYINAEMVKAFLSSIEYRQRFGP